MYITVHTECLSIKATLNISDERNYVYLEIWKIRFRRSTYRGEHFFLSTVFFDNRFFGHKTTFSNRVPSYARQTTIIEVDLEFGSSSKSKILSRPSSESTSRKNVWKIANVRNDRSAFLETRFVSYFQFDSSGTRIAVCVRFGKRSTVRIVPSRRMVTTQT